VSVLRHRYDKIKDTGSKECLAREDEGEEKKKTVAGFQISLSSGVGGGRGRMYASAYANRGGVFSFAGLIPIRDV
jgi:hypothetical protein